MPTATDKKGIYDLGFNTCLKNLLKKSTVTNIPLLSFANGELSMKTVAKTEVDAALDLSDIKVVLN